MLTGMFDRDSLIKRALETGWPFVAGLMAELRGALSAPGEGAVPLNWTSYGHFTDQPDRPRTAGPGAKARHARHAEALFPAAGAA